MAKMRRYDRIMQMLSDGQSYEVIAEKFRTEPGTIRVYDLARTGRLSDLTTFSAWERPMKNRAVPFDDWELARIKRMREQGEPITAIAQAVGRQYDSVKNLIYRKGYESPKIAQHRTQEEYRERIIALYESGVGGPVKIADTLGGVTQRMVENVIGSYRYANRKRRICNGNQTDHGVGTGGADAGQPRGAAAALGNQ